MNSMERKLLGLGVTGGYGKSKGNSLDSIERKLLGLGVSGGLGRKSTLNSIERRLLELAQGSGVSGGKHKLPKAANDWKNFAVKVYYDLKKSNPGILYKDALKVASQEWHQL